LYSNLFKVEEVSDENWEEELNPSSEIVILDALVR
jgi:hypothetical protein